MFLRVKRNRRREYLMLVENYWDNGRVRQRVLRSFGRLDRIDPVTVNRFLSTMPGFAFLKYAVPPMRQESAGAPHGATPPAPPPAKPARPG